MPFLCPTQHGRVGYGLPSTERPHGPSAAESALCACRATATVLHACASKEVATRSHQDAWAAPNGIAPQFCPLSSITVVQPPQSTPAQAGQGATDARNAPSAYVKVRTRGIGCEQRAKGTVGS